MLKSLMERVYIGHLLFTTEVVLPVRFANPYFILGWNYEMCLTGKEPDLRVEVYGSLDLGLMLSFDSHFIKDKREGLVEMYYPDGTLWRTEEFKKGVSQGGHVYDKEGKEIDFYPSERMAVFQVVQMHCCLL